MAKVNKLALLRLTLYAALRDLQTTELLCVLSDIYTGSFEGNHSPRWYGSNGTGTAGLEQGVYNYMTTFRRFADLWAKITEQVKNDKESLKLEVYAVRDVVVEVLEKRGIDLKQVQEEAAAANE